MRNTHPHTRTCAHTYTCAHTLVCTRTLQVAPAVEVATFILGELRGLATGLGAAGASALGLQVIDWAQQVGRKHWGCSGCRVIGLLRLQGHRAA